METAQDRAKRTRRQRYAAITAVVVLIAADVVHSSGQSIGLTLLEIAIALVVVALLLMLFAHSLGKYSARLDEARRTEPNSYLCTYGNGKRGIISAHDGALILSMFKGKKTGVIDRIPLAQCVIRPAAMQLTAVRQVDGIAIADTATPGERIIAVSHDKMTLLGNYLKGPELERAVTGLLSGSYAGGAH